MEQAIISGVAHDRSEAKITVVGVPGQAGRGRGDLPRGRRRRDQHRHDRAERLGGRDRHAPTSRSRCPRPTAQARDADAGQGPGRRSASSDLLYDDHIGKVSLVGAGMRSHPGVSATFFAALADAGVNVEMISTSEIRISVVVRDTDLRRRRAGGARRVRPRRLTDEAVVLRRDRPMSRPDAGRRRRHRRGRHRDAATAVRAAGRLGRDPADRLAAVGRQGAARCAARRSWSRRSRAEVFDGVDVADVRRAGRGLGAVGADRGGARRHRRRQLRRLPDGPGRAAGGARGQRGRGAPTGRAGIIANPNCTTLSMIVALGALHRAGSCTELSSRPTRPRPAPARPASTGSTTSSRRWRRPHASAQIAGDVRKAVGDGASSPFPAPLALNVVPFAGSRRGRRLEQSEELKVRNESRKILGIPDLKVSATCVRVPVVTTHSLAVHAAFARPVDVDGRPAELLEGARCRGARRPGPAAVSSRRRPTSSAPTRPTSGRIRSGAGLPERRSSCSCAATTCARARRSTPPQIAELVAAELS